MTNINSGQIPDWQSFHKIYKRRRFRKNLMAIAPLALLLIIGGVLLWPRENASIQYSIQHLYICNNVENRINININEPSPISMQKIQKTEIAIYDTPRVDSSEDNVEIKISSKDTVKEFTNPSIENDYLACQNVENNTPILKNKKRKISISFSGSSFVHNERDFSYFTTGGLPGTGHGSDDLEKYSCIHFPPIIFGIDVNYNISKPLCISTGLSYSLYYSRILKEMPQDNNCYEATQRLGYLGIPIKMNYYFGVNSKLSAYLSCGFLMETCINATEASQYNKINKHILVSGTMSCGIQYGMSNTISLFVEPSFSHLINGSDYYVSYRGQNPNSFSFKVGMNFKL